MDKDDIVWGLAVEDVQEVAKSMGLELTESEIGKVADLFSDGVDWWETLIMAIKEVKKNGCMPKV